MTSHRSLEDATALPPDSLTSSQFLLVSIAVQRETQQQSLRRGNDAGLLGVTAHDLNFTQCGCCVLN